MSEDTRRINVTFPVQLLEELDAFISPRKRSEVIVQATAAYVRQLKMLLVLKQSSGAWNDASHPELATSEDINTWLAEKRMQWRGTLLPISEVEHV